MAVWPVMLWSITSSCLEFPASLSSTGNLCAALGITSYHLTPLLTPVQSGRGGIQLLPLP